MKKEEEEEEETFPLTGAHEHKMTQPFSHAFQTICITTMVS